jgi:hypothetical protein
MPVMEPALSGLGDGSISKVSVMTTGQRTTAPTQMHGGRPRTLRSAGVGLEPGGAVASFVVPRGGVR